MWKWNLERWNGTQVVLPWETLTPVSAVLSLCVLFVIYKHPPRPPTKASAVTPTWLATRSCNSSCCRTSRFLLQQDLLPPAQDALCISTFSQWTAREKKRMSSKKHQTSVAFCATRLISNQCYRFTSKCILQIHVRLPFWHQLHSTDWLSDWLFQCQTSWLLSSALMGLRKAWVNYILQKSNYDTHSHVTARNEKSRSQPQH